jgi:hypothetical protein
MPSRGQIGLRALVKDAIFPAAVRTYHVKIVEVEKKLIEADVVIGETELLNARFAFDDES